MGSSTTTLPALATNPKIIFFTDYDGTITQQDSNDHMTDNVGYGPERRQAGNDAVLKGTRHFRDAFQEMMDSVTLPFSECISLLGKNITLDPAFKDFFHWCKDNNVPIVILSGGMRPIIKGMLRGWLGDEETETIQIVSNDVAVREGKTSIDEEGGWRIEFHDESVFGHDKSREIRPYAQLPEGERPILLYAGDGVSDLSAAKETDLLFAKAGRDLVTWCERENVKFTTFEDFSEILATVKDIASGKLSVKDAATGRK
ncbi:2,3-diketo-5-methylthio-1-phosphopentane phosphatase [Coniochaeta ligniaria NRRL 30616]|uniref:2,3-diketo-5-methylthio-1-phosphopentane phosphatase n=1 Tax=Coniochaeta ligniaria NRRL 30616 TaxID=1408157 RepID=A0A1J7IM57_9PEZI|nr:2,3-diketo-5-methylthio-1-phosphopentane phosphatase [Coniochaeta ligniaria NRRL 30616]